MGPEAAAGVMAITAIIGAGTAAYSAKQQFDAAEEAEEIGKKNAELAELETEEEVKRVEKAQKRESSLAKARAAASGIAIEEGTTALYLADIETTQKEELDWLKRTGSSRARTLKDQGRFAAAQAEAGAYSSLGQMFSYAPSIYSGGRKAEWWGTP